MSGTWTVGVHKEGKKGSKEVSTGAEMVEGDGVKAAPLWIPAHSGAWRLCLRMILHDNSRAQIGK